MQIIVCEVNTQNSFFSFSFVSVLTMTLTSGCICKWIWSIGETKIDDTKGIYFIHCFLNYDSCIYIQMFFCDIHVIYVYGKKDLDGMELVTNGDLWYSRLTSWFGFG